MKKIFKKFQVKDFVFLAVLSAAMTLCGGITMPLVMHTTVFGLRNMAAAPIYSIFVAIGLMKVRKPGALTIIGLFSGAPLIFFSTVMFFNNFVSAIIAELIMLLFSEAIKRKFPFSLQREYICRFHCRFLFCSAFGSMGKVTLSLQQIRKFLF